jgi:dihydroorotase
MNTTTLQPRDVPALIIRGARIVDPFVGRDEEGDVFVVEGRFADTAPRDAMIIDAEDCLVCPGLFDMHVHLREPGFEDKETIATGSAAAAAGGFTRVACMPNTRPALDHPDVLHTIRERAAEANLCTVLPVAALTRGRRGKEIVDIAALLEAGAVAFSDDGDGIDRDDVMATACARAAEHNALIMQHCEFREISAGGVMHAGPVAERLGLPGLDPRSEEAMIERDLDLVRQTGARYHVSHISTARAVQMVREARAAGLPVTAEVTPHHLTLTHEACAEADPNTKMHPPLRTAEDVEACCAGLLDGTIDAIATDHAPHTPEEKAAGFRSAPPGVLGLETALGLAEHTFVKPDRADWPQVIGWFTSGPARVLRLPGWSLEPGQPAELAIFDLDAPRKVDPELSHSKSRNTPFAGWRLAVWARATVRGRAVTLIE